MAEERGTFLVRFQWDEGNLGHITNHDVSPEEAEEVVCNQPAVIALQNRSGEERLQQVGETRAGRVLVVVTTPRDQMIRVVTAFDAPQKLRQIHAAWRTISDEPAAL